MDHGDICLKTTENGILLFTYTKQSPEYRNPGLPFASVARIIDQPVLDLFIYKFS